MTATAATSTLQQTATPSGKSDTLPVPDHGNPVVAFIIGMAIVLFASILNAAGLNLTKLDHVRPVTSTRTSSSDASDRSAQALYHDLREGKIGYGLYGCWACYFTCAETSVLLRASLSDFSFSSSQLIGSTLALEYLRAGEQGSTSGVLLMIDILSLQNMLLPWAPLRSSSTSFLLDSLLALLSLRLTST